jgi:hypothetical protein
VSTQLSWSLWVESEFHPWDLGHENIHNVTHLGAIPWPGAQGVPRESPWSTTDIFTIPGNLDFWAPRGLTQHPQGLGVCIPMLYNIRKPFQLTPHELSNRVNQGLVGKLKSSTFDVSLGKEHPMGDRL